MSLTSPSPEVPASGEDSAAFEAFSEIPHAKITATEDLAKFSDEQTGLIDPSITERQRRQARVPNYSAHQ